MIPRWWRGEQLELNACENTNLTGECGGKHAGEEFERDRKQELHEGNDDEDGEGNQTKQVRHCPDKLSKTYKMM